jgi:ABC-type glycerol-3-phosphate transport system substrate-binding protein
VYALALALFVLLAACGTLNTATPTPPAVQTTTAQASPTASEQVSLRWSVWGSAEELRAHQRVAAAFMQKHPEIALTVEHTPWEDYHPKLKQAMETGDAAAIPDVIFLSDDLQRFAREGRLENLSTWIDQTDYDYRDYWPTLIEEATVDGKIYGLQRDLDLSLLYYNKTLFDEAGVAYPDEDWRWEEWAAAAEKLTKRSADGAPTQHGLAMEAGKWNILLFQSSGSFVDDTTNPSRCTLDSEGALQAARFFRGLIDSDVAVSPADLARMGGDAAAFVEGKAAMIVQNASRAATFNEAQLNYDVAPIPFPEGGRRVNNSGGAYWVMSSSSQHKAAAWTFLSWLQSPDGGQRIYASSGGIFPAIRSVAASWAFTSRAQQPANRNAFMIEASNTQPITSADFDEWVYVDDTIITPNLEKIWNGEGEIEATITQLCDELNAFLQQKGYPK